ncbi:MAG: hypothetical protein EBU93_06315 [Chlamydiae bacterium]|nr:hypothetical protein [Chlamydiota bacterium]
MQSQLDGIVKQYKENERKRDYFYQQRAEEEKKEAAMRNRKIREEKENKSKQKQLEEGNTTQNDENIENSEQHSNTTETFDSNRIEQLLNERRQELNSNVGNNIKNEANELFKQALSNESQQAGFDSIDPWMARKIANKNKELKEDSDDDEED